MKVTEQESQVFKEACQVWEKAGLDFKRTILMFTPPGNNPQELRTDSAFKQLAQEGQEGR